MEDFILSNILLFAILGAVFGFYSFLPNTGKLKKYFNWVSPKANAVIGLSISIISLTVITPRFYHLSQAKNWLESEGIIIESKKLIDMRRSFNRNSNLLVKYQYVVKSKTFTGKNFVYSVHDQYRYKYEIGKHVRVFYDPTNPEIAYLTNEVDFNTNWTMFFCVIGVVFSFLGLGATSWNKQYD